LTSEACCKSCTKMDATQMCKNKLRQKKYGCNDKYGNCKALARNCCVGKTLSSGMKTSVGCCKSCKAVDNTPMCKEKARIDIEGAGRNSVKFMKEDP